MSGSISKICVSFWKWNYILHGEFNCSCDLAYKACRISNKSHYLKRQGRVKKALKKFWRCDRYNLGTARRVWALGLGGVFSSPSSHRAAHKLITLGKLLNLSGLGLYKYKTQIIKRTYNTLSKLGYFGSSDGNESACNAGDQSSIPGSGRCPGEGNGNPLQYSCLENSADRGAWWATVHGMAKSWTRLSD